MRALGLALGLAGAAACGGDPQIVLELAGDVPGARWIGRSRWRRVRSRRRWSRAAR